MMQQPEWYEVTLKTTKGWREKLDAFIKEKNLQIARRSLSFGEKERIVLLRGIKEEIETFPLVVHIIRAARPTVQ